MRMIPCPWCRDKLDLADELYTQQHLAEHLRMMREGAAEVEQEGRDANARWTAADFTKNYPPHSER